MTAIALIDLGAMVFSNRVILLDMVPTIREIRRDRPHLPMRKVADFIVRIGNESIATGRRFEGTLHESPFTKADTQLVTHNLLTKLIQLFGDKSRLTELHRHFIFQVTQRRSDYPQIALVDIRSQEMLDKLSKISF